MAANHTMKSQLGFCGSCLEDDRGDNDGFIWKKKERERGSSRREET
jgi:hypothetical protein